jgi:dipeptidase D
MKGGDKDNAIPRYAQAEAIVSMEDVDALAVYVKELEEKYQKELLASEPNIKFECQIFGEEKAKVIHPSSMMKVLFALLQAPNGVQVMSSEMDGLVESSLNLGIFAIEDDMAIFHYSVRSSKSSYKHFITDKLSFMFGFLGAEYESNADYPAWEYKKESKLRDLFLNVYKEQYNKDAEVMSIHAGLECGLISEKIPDMDIISIGPDIKDAHTPREHLFIPSTIRVYQTVEKLLQKMK